MRSRSPPGAGRMKRPSSARRSAGISWSSASSRSVAASSRRQVVVGRPAGDQRLDRRPVRTDAPRRLGHGEQQVDPLLGRGRLADDVEAVRDQRVLELEDRPAQLADAGLGLLGRPGGLRLRQVDGRRLRLDQDGELPTLGTRLGQQAAPALDRGLELEQAAVEPGVRHRRGQVADQRRRRAPLGDHSLRRVVGGVEVEVRQVADQPVRPAVGGEAGLLAGHELQRAVRAEVQHGVRTQVLAQVAVEGGERVGRREAVLEQEPHRVALVAEGGLDADQHVPEPLAEHVDGAAVALLPPRRRAPLRLDVGEPALAAHVLVGGDAGDDVGVRPEAGRVADQDALAQVRLARRQVARARSPRP